MDEGAHKGQLVNRERIAATYRIPEDTIPDQLRIASEPVCTPKTSYADKMNPVSFIDSFAAFALRVALRAPTQKEKIR